MRVSRDFSFGAPSILNARTCKPFHMRGRERAIVADARLLRDDTRANDLEALGTLLLRVTRLKPEQRPRAEKIFSARGLFFATKFIPLPSSPRHQPTGSPTWAVPQSVRVATTPPEAIRERCVRNFLSARAFAYAKFWRTNVSTCRNASAGTELN